MLTAYGTQSCADYCQIDLSLENINQDTFAPLNYKENRKTDRHNNNGKYLNLKLYFFEK